MGESTFLHIGESKSAAKATTMDGFECGGVLGEKEGEKECGGVLETKGMAGGRAWAE